MARVPYRHREDAFDDAERAVFDRLESERKMPTPNIFLALAHAPTQLDGLLTYAKSLRAANELGSGLRELVILALATAKSGDYIAGHHTADAIRAGYDETQIAAIARREDLTAHFDETEVAVINFGYAAGAGGKFDPGVWTAAARHLSDRQMVQLTMTACWYVAGVLMMDILDLDREPADQQYREPTGVNMR